MYDCRFNCPNLKVKYGVNFFLKQINTLYLKCIHLIHAQFKTCITIEYRINMSREDINPCKKQNKPKPLMGSRRGFSKSCYNIHEDCKYSESRGDQDESCFPSPNLHRLARTGDTGNIEKYLSSVCLQGR